MTERADLAAIKVRHAASTQGESEYKELKANGLSDHNIAMLRNTGASHGAILLYAKKLKESA